MTIVMTPSFIGWSPEKIVNFSGEATQLGGGSLFHRTKFQRSSD